MVQSWIKVGKCCSSILFLLRSCSNGLQNEKPWNMYTYVVLCFFYLGWSIFMSWSDSKDKDWSYCPESMSSQKAEATGEKRPRGRPRKWVSQWFWACVCCWHAGYWNTCCPPRRRDCEWGVVPVNETYLWQEVNVREKAQQKKETLEQMILLLHTSHSRAFWYIGTWRVLSVGVFPGFSAYWDGLFHCPSILCPIVYFRLLSLSFLSGLLLVCVCWGSFPKCSRYQSKKMFTLHADCRNT